MLHKVVKMLTKGFGFYNWLYPGPGRMVLAAWSWPHGLGLMVLATWSWPPALTSWPYPLGWVPDVCTDVHMDQISPAFHRTSSF